MWNRITSQDEKIDKIILLESNSQMWEGGVSWKNDVGEIQTK